MNFSGDKASKERERRERVLNMPLNISGKRKLTHDELIKLEQEPQQKSSSRQ